MPHYNSPSKSTPKSEYPLGKLERELLLIPHPKIYISNNNLCMGIWNFFYVSTHKYKITSVQNFLENIYTTHKSSKLDSCIQIKGQNQLGHVNISRIRITQLALVHYQNTKVYLLSARTTLSLEALTPT